MTSPSCDWAYSLMPTVAVSPSIFTHSWVSANRIPLTSGIVTPFASFRMRPLVEGQRNHLCRCSRAPNIDAKTGPGLRKGRRHVGHPDVVAKREGDVSRGYGTDLLAVFDNGIAVTGNASIQHFEAHQGPAQPPLTGLEDGVAADEVLVEAEGPVEARLERIRAGVDVVAMKAHPCFEAQGVPCPKARRSDAVGLARIEQSAPEPHGILVAAKQFKAIFARVAGARDHARDIRDLALDKGVVLHGTDLRAAQPLHEGNRAWSLHADQRPIPPDVEDAPTLPSPKGGGDSELPSSRGGWFMAADPVEVAVLVAGIHDHQVAAVGNRIDQDIIDDAAGLVAKHGVLNAVRPQPREVTRDHALGETLVFDTQLTHVRKVEEPDRFTHRAMFFADAAVLEGHDPASEVGHLGA